MSSRLGSEVLEARKSTR